MTEGAEKRGQGRPTKWRPEYDEQVYKLCLLGATNKEIADFFKVEVSTIHYWLTHEPSFSSSVTRGREVADSNVAKSLYQRAIGYTHKEMITASYQGQITDTKEVIKHYPPDTPAATLWLKNRQPQKWRDAKQVDATLFRGDVANLPPEVQLEIYKRAIAQIEQRLLVEGSDQKQGSE